MNPKAVLHVRSEADLDSIIEQIKWLDSNDEAFLAMLKEPLFLDKNHKAIFDEKLEAFLFHIFTPPLGFARSEGQIAKMLNKRYKRAISLFRIYSIIKSISKPLRVLRSKLRR